MRMKGCHILLGLSLSLLVMWSGPLYAQSHLDRSSGERNIQKVYETILDRYVAEIDPDKLANAAIEGMLSELDPYSQHIDNNNSYRLDAITTGEYGGVGIHLGRMNDSLIVISPMDGTPAYHQGILAGDRIIAIDSLSTKKMSLSEAADLVRGEKGSILRLKILRMGSAEPLVFELERELIKVPDVSYSGLLEDRVGYIKLSNFSKYSSEELEKAVRKLDRTHLNGLIIDLRGNPGGLLSSALQSADLFIPNQALLLETRGRLAQANRKYTARRNPIVSPDLPLIVLIDGGSASASEILAGILQDYDRAVLVGQESFGKGLVQTVTPLSEDSRLKLTTAKYYLPSGRLIQKRQIAEDVIYEDLLEIEGERFRSEANRSFEAGEGVAPDIEVSDLSLSDMERQLWQQRLFFRYALQYHEKHPGLVLPVQLSAEDVTDFKRWLDERQLFPQTRLSRYLQKAGESLDTSKLIYADWTRLQTDLDLLLEKEAMDEYGRNETQILSGLETELARILGGSGARIEATLKHDPVVARGLELLKSPEAFHAILTQNDLEPSTD
jgi:carboxyl-terminal processing protease